MNELLNSSPDQNCWKSLHSSPLSSQSSIVYLLLQCKDLNQCCIPYLHRHGLGDQHQYHYEGTRDGGLMLKQHKQCISTILCLWGSSSLEVHVYSITRKPVGYLQDKELKTQSHNTDRPSGGKMIWTWDLWITNLCSSLLPLGHATSSSKLTFELQLISNKGYQKLFANEWHKNKFTKHNYTSGFMKMVSIICAKSHVFHFDFMTPKGSLHTSTVNLRGNIQ